MEQVTIEYKGVPISGNKDCILQCFVHKKTRKGVAIKTYDLSIVPDLHLKIENHFYEEVLLYQEQEFSAPATATPKVSGSVTIMYIA